MKNIAIIYCPIHKPFSSTGKRWDKIAASLEQHGIEYDMVQSERNDSVARLIKMMIHNGYETIVIAGGDSALNEAANCLMETDAETREKISLGVIANGVMNDFASFWGFDYDNIEHCVESIKQNRIRKIDVGRISFTNKDGDNKERYFLNSINVGLLAGIQILRQKMRRKFLSRKISFAVSMLMMLFQKMEYKMEYTINYVTEKHSITTLCIGNAYGYGQTPNAVPYNGLLDITIVRRSKFVQFLGGMYLFLRGKILNHKRVRPYRSRFIEMNLINKTPVSIDGHPMEMPSGKFKVDVMQEQINFIIEKYK